MKSILKTLKSEPIANILNGKQKVIVCKKFPKDYVGWVYIYCTKWGENCWSYETYCGANDIVKYGVDLSKEAIEQVGINELNGKVVARFWCDKVEEIFIDYITTDFITDTLSCEELYKRSCLDFCSMDDYLYNSKQKEVGYAIHISKLEIFDKPRELWEFEKYGMIKYLFDHCTDDYVDDNWNELLYLQKAPQNYCYVEGEE